MRIFLLFTLFAACSNGFAQTSFDYLKCQKVLSEKVENIKLKLWNGVVNGEITPYKSNELAEVRTIVDIRNLCQGEDSLEMVKRRQDILERKNRDTSKSSNDSWSASWNDSNWSSDWKLDPVDSAILSREDKWNLDDTLKYHLKKYKDLRYDFDSTRDIRGLIISYERRVEGSSIQFSPKAFGLLIDITVEGIFLGSYPIFWIDQQELEMVLSIEEVQFLEALGFQRAALGDFLPSGLSLKRQNYLEGISSSNLDTRFNSRSTQEITQEEIAIISEYNAIVFEDLGNQILELKLPQDKYFFKDSTLKKGYRNIRETLQEEFELEMEDLLDDDPYDIVTIVSSVTWSFEFRQMDTLIIERIKNDYLIKFENSVSKIGFLKPRIEEHNVFISYNAIKHLLQPHDRSVLDMLLEEIVK
ncbi:MAG: hypothetical protein COA58_05295 [Bacteroidetes bacterium]|nr:MAG: hypothetical protein COA58_05295 [Bacteroidota bacterium]